MNFNYLYSFIHLFLFDCLFESSLHFKLLSPDLMDAHLSTFHMHTFCCSTIHVCFLKNFFFSCINIFECIYHGKNISQRNTNIPRIISYFEQEVDKQQGQDLADSYGIAFFETSAKADIGVQEAFTHLVHAVCGRILNVRL